MTLKEAYEAGLKHFPVVYNGNKYKRILRCGYTFSESAVIPYAELLSFADSSVVVAKVDLVELDTEVGS